MMTCRFVKSCVLSTLQYSLFYILFHDHKFITFSDKDDGESTSACMRDKLVEKVVS